MLTSVKESIPVTRKQNVRTPLDHMYVNVSLDILEMDKIAEVNLIAFLWYKKTLTRTVRKSPTFTPQHSALLENEILDDRFALFTMILRSSQVMFLFCN